MQNFKIPGDIVFGENALSHLTTLKGNKAMIVTGGSSMKKFGFLDQARKYLEDSDFTVEIFDGVEENPSVETILKGKEAMLQFEPDWIIAIGGGSPMDAAKIMWAMYEHPEVTFEYLGYGENFPKLRNKARLVCIPSTSGTASEITSTGVVTDTKNHVKYPISSPEIVPDIAIIDPILPSKMPKHITANTGMDVLTHASEAITSTGASDYTDALAIQAIKLVFKYLPIAYNEPDNIEAREKMHNASAMAGMAFASASLGISHSLAHKIGGMFGITHGLANAILLPYVTQFNRKSTDKVDWIERELGIEDFPNAIKELNKKLNIPLSFKDTEGFGLEDNKKFYEELKNMSVNAQDDPCTLTNPRETNPEILALIYEHAYKGEDITK
ncbi:iron-containing alcohol dehydrogenase [Miniphocaeibacter halophilus]|uniref:Iron-containing alcohol dehydrogenase n=1 Tax=Miniphocaeibacter halophilus TaxID=2931922 RepID=A0AC61MSW5_9FIRM|nr:iron-containing alcohol dehydrogenase [Miniphocaeibacter halophilus]QQK08428.1 iron-containing alcohol dehydrogenase [Miniphocaeibacter halophilus]